jgi:hypothetical protein
VRQVGARQLGAFEVARVGPDANARAALLLAAPALRTASGSTTSPPENAIVATLPSRQTITSRRLASALVTLTPTPCKPPEKLYAALPPLSNLPPACRRVKTISTTLTRSSGCRPTGMPRPSSSTLTEPSPWRVTSIAVATPAERFVGRVVDDFLDDVERALGARVHARPLLHRLEPLENADRRLAVLRLPCLACHGGAF